MLQREVVLLLDGTEPAGAESEAAKLGIERVIRATPPDESDARAPIVTVSDSNGKSASAAWVRIGGAADMGRAIDASSGDYAFVVVECPNWKVIPLENLLAEFRRRGRRLYAYVKSDADVELAFSILERGVDGVVVPADLAAAASHLVGSGGDAPFRLMPAKVTRVLDVGLGERACVDTTSQLSLGEGMLIGSKAGFMFLVHSETIPSEFIATRPFRVNAGALHSYMLADREKTRYLSELQAGDPVLVVDKSGSSRRATVGRVKIERRPLVMVEAAAGSEKGSVIVQKAETIRLVTGDGEPVAVTDLKVGDEVLVAASGPKARHFGGEVDEFVIEK